MEAGAVCSFCHCNHSPHHGIEVVTRGPLSFATKGWRPATRSLQEACSYLQIATIIWRCCGACAGAWDHIHEVRQSMKELGYVCPRGVVLGLRLEVQEHLNDTWKLGSRRLAVVVSIRGQAPVRSPVQGWAWVVGQLQPWKVSNLSKFEIGTSQTSKAQSPWCRSRPCRFWIPLD